MKGKVKIEVFEKAPDDFEPRFHVAGAYVTAGDKLLLLQNAEHKKDAKRWGVPAGKLENEEMPETAVRRELFEETGIALEPTVPVHSLGKLFVRESDHDFVYHPFKVELESQDLDAPPPISLSHEHTGYHWCTLEEAKKLSLVGGGEEALDFYLSCSKKREPTTHLHVYLILKEEGEILMHKRKGTGYFDGFYGLVGGHVEKGESGSAAIIRETKEEAGIELDQAHLKVVHVMHRKSGRLSMDIFFECTSWKGTALNQEPHKCSFLGFVSLHSLPDDTVPYIRDVLKAIEEGKLYSEQGW